MKRNNRKPQIQMWQRDPASLKGDDYAICNVWCDGRRSGEIVMSGARDMVAHGAAYVEIENCIEYVPEARRAEVFGLPVTQR